MCRSEKEGGRRCPSDSPANRQRRGQQKRQRAANRQQSAQNAVTAFIGATPFRPESEALLAMSSRDSYYESDEWQEWSDRIKVIAERRGVTLIEGDPAVEHADGLWMGETEPSGAYTVTGTRENIEAWAAEVAGNYNQDAVMVLYADPDGQDRLYRFTGGNGDTQHVLDSMSKAGIPGGRIVDGNLEIVSTHDEPVSIEALRAIQNELGASGIDGSPVTASFVEKDEKYLTHAPIKEIQAIRQRHAEKHGLPVRKNVPHLTEADDLAMALAYENGKHDPKDPEVKRSYQELRSHIAEQYTELAEAGYVMEPWDGQLADGTEQEQPYLDSASMIQDLRDNKHLYYFRTEVSQSTEGALPPDHPMAAPVTVKDANGEEHTLVANDAFRAVHDAIAHSEGHKFGPHGEKMAWWTHRSSLPRRAHLALANETRAQNVENNVGVAMRRRNPDGTWHVLKPGDEGYMTLAERPYAEQKCVRLPPELT